MKDISSKSSESNRHFRTDHLKTDLKGRTARGGAVTMVAQICKFGLTLGSGATLARLLTPGDYGLVGMVTVVTGFISIFKDLGLSTATIQKDEITHDQVSTLFWLNVAFSVVTMLVAILLTPVIASFYQEPRLIWITISLATGFVISGLGVQHAALLNRQMRFKALVINDVLSMFAGVVTGIIAAWYGCGYWALVISSLTTATVSTLGLWIVCGWRPGSPVWRSGIRSMLMFGGNLTGFSIINYFARNLDNVLIGRYWGAQQLGLYARAYQLLMLPLQQINGPISSVAVPALSRLVDSPERYRQAYLGILEKLVVFTTPLVVFMIATSDWLISVLLGSQWEDASQLFSLLCIAALVQPVSNTTGWIFITQGRVNQMFRWGVIGSTLSIIAIVAGLPWGATGVAASYAISGILIRTPILFWYVGRSGAIRTSDFYRAMSPSLIASLCALGGVMIFRHFTKFTNPLLNVCIALAITISVVLPVLVILPPGRKTLQDFKTLLPLIFKNRREVKL